MDRTLLLPKYASYLHSERLSDFISLFFQRSREISFSFIDFDKSRIQNEKTNEIESKLNDLLQALSDKKGKRFTSELIHLWKENKLPNIPPNHEGVVIQVTSINIQKYVFIKLLREYTQDLELREEIMLELVEFYSFYFLKLIEAYSEIQQSKILQEKEFSQSIINHSIIGIAALDLDYKVTEWNPAMEKWMNVKKEEVIGKNYYDLFPEYKDSETAHLFKRTYEGEVINLYDRQYEGRRGWFDAHFAPLYNSKREVIGALSIAHDTTEKKEAEIKNKEDQHFIQTLADSSPDVITVYDLEKNINIYSSKEIYQILGYNQEELKELIDKGIQGLIETIHPDDLNIVIGFLESYKSYTGSEPRELEYRIKDNKGKYRHILDRYNVFKKSSEGLPTQIIGIARDNTARKETEEKLVEYSKEIHNKNQELMQALEELKSAEENLIYLNNQLEDRITSRTQELTDSNNELRRINSDLDNFIYTASHDLKAPILNIEGLTNALQKKLLSRTADGEQQLVEMIQLSVNRFKKTINDLTEITKIQKNLDNSLADLSFKEVIEDVKIEIQTLFKQAGKVSVQEDLAIENVNYAPRNLRSIVYNLLSNALKYRSPERDLKIHLATYNQNGYTVLSVSDNGLGISSDQLPKLFQMFKRMHTHIDGTGIGLYILKRIVENNNGRIEVESKIDEGTTFKVYFKI